MDVDREQEVANQQAQDGIQQDATQEEAPQGAQTDSAQEAPVEEESTPVEESTNDEAPVEGEDDVSADEQPEQVRKPGGVGAPNIGPENDPRVAGNVENPAA